MDRIVASIEVKVNGSELQATGLGPELIEVTVEDTLDMASKFTLRLNTWDLNTQKVSWADKKPLTLGAEVAIYMGYLDAKQCLIVGDVISLEASFSAGSPPVLTAIGYDFRHRLSRGHVIHPYPKGWKDSQIAKDVIDRNQLEAEVSPTQDERTGELQNNQTDLEFLQKLAQRNGYEVVVSGKKVRFGPPSAHSGAPIPMSLNADLGEFNPRISVEKIFKKILVPGKTNDNTEFTGSATCENFPGYLAGVDQLSPKEDTYDQQVVKSESEANTVAKAQIDKSLREVLTGTGKCAGNPDIRAGVVLDIKDAGKRFSRKYRVTSATHSFSGSAGYSTSFNLVWSAT